MLSISTGVAGAGMPQGRAVRLPPRAAAAGRLVRGPRDTPAGGAASGDGERDGEEAGAGGGRMAKMKSCQQCELRWDECRCPSWPLRLFVYAKPQLFWLLKNGLSWPDGDAGFTDERVQRSKTGSAPFEAVVCVVAEIEARLARCGEAGEALRDEAIRAECVNDLSRPAKRALWYCTGWKRKRISYALWKWRRKRTSPPVIISAKMRLI
jgi:hypothetical protein